MLVDGAVELGEQEGQGGAAWRRAVLPADLGVATLHGTVWHGRRARKGASAAVESLRAGAEGACGAVNMARRCFGVASASSTEVTRAAARHGRQWRGASCTPPLGLTSTCNLLPSSEGEVWSEWGLGEAEACRREHDSEEHGGVQEENMSSPSFPCFTASSSLFLLSLSGQL